MSLLADHAWKIRYSPEDGDLLHQFYIPLLRCASRYDRASGYFSAATFIDALSGIEGLIKNGGKMRLLVGCDLPEAEQRAIWRGEELAAALERELLHVPLEPDSPARRDGLELLSWLIAHGYLSVRIGIPCDRQTRQPLSGIFHEKTGLVEDASGARLAFNGSINETGAGWKSRNWDAFHVYRSWRSDIDHLESIEEDFQNLWAGTYATALTFSLTEAVRRKLLAFQPPPGELPARLKPQTFTLPEEAPQIAGEAEEIWRRVAEGAREEAGGKWVGMATCAVKPWPHQINAFLRMYENWPPRLLIADEVGLGKTIQAGLLLRQALLAGRARRILIMAPKAVLLQWQLELREKFNLRFPIYDGGRLNWPEGTAALTGAWHEQPLLLASAELMRQRRSELLDEAAPWDLVILDEAHHARRKGGHKNEPNKLLRLMRGLKQRTAGLLLLTATPMQVDPIEVWDLLDLLGLPPGWTAESFLRFFELVQHPAPDNALLEETARLYREATAFFGPVPERVLAGLNLQGFWKNRLLRALGEQNPAQRKRLAADQRQLALKLMAAHTPVAALISRHTRELLRQYRASGKMDLRLATREVTDQLVRLAPAEAELYRAVEDYITESWQRAAAEERSAVGFVLTVYRRRLASSFYALEKTLGKRLAGLQAAFDEEDAPADELKEAGEPGALERQLREEERVWIESLLAKIRRLGPDTKLRALFAAIRQLEAAGYRQVIIFTQYTDTLDWLSGELLARFGQESVLRFSGRGGERVEGSSWQKISREKTRELFRCGKARVLLCTEAAAEGLNFQFCGALINYDMPWNPMRVEQRIGRIDRLGQEHEQIRIINLMYADTVEADIYQALHLRIDLFQTYVGRLQPILARLPEVFEQAAMSGDRQQALARVEQLTAAPSNDFDLDAVAQAAIELPQDMRPAWDMSLLAEALERGLLPPGYAAARLGSADWLLTAPGSREKWRISVEPDFYAEHSDSVELWSPGAPHFPVKFQA